MKASELHYSGPRSTKFWNRVNKVHRANGRDQLLFIVGCHLQDVEGRMLQLLELAEAEAEASKRRVQP